MISKLPLLLLPLIPACLPLPVRTPAPAAKIEPITTKTPAPPELHVTFDTDHTPLDDEMFVCGFKAHLVMECISYDQFMGDLHAIEARR